MMEDWGDSEGTGKLATLREVHSHRKDERRFQTHVLLIFSVMSAGALGLQAFDPNIIAKDYILAILPVFTFVLGKLETKNG